MTGWHCLPEAHQLSLRRPCRRRSVNNVIDGLWNILSRRYKLPVDGFGNRVCLARIYADLVQGKEAWIKLYGDSRPSRDCSSFLFSPCQGIVFSAGGGARMSYAIRNCRYQHELNKMYLPVFHVLFGLWALNQANLPSIRMPNYIGVFEGRRSHEAG